MRTLFVAVHSNYALFFLSFSLSLYIYIFIYFLFTLHVSVMNGPVHTTCTRGIHNIFMNFNNAHWHFFTTCYPTQIITLSFVPAEHASFHVYHPHFDINYFGTSLSFQTWWKIEHSHISLLPLSRQADVLFNGSHAFNQPFWCFLNFSNCFCLVFIVGLDSLLSVYI